MNRPYTTLFLIQSLDGKISTGLGYARDVDRDFKKIKGVREGLFQYYELEKKTDLVSLNSGVVMEKIGVNKRTNTPEKIPVTFVVIDNNPHLNEKGVNYLKAWTKRLIIVTTNTNHPAKKDSSVEVLEYSGDIDFKDMLNALRETYGFERLTIQTGGTLNAVWLREGLLDEISIVIAPVLIGGKDTKALIEGEALKTLEDLKKAKALELLSCKRMENSYLHLRYKVINNTQILEHEPS